MIQASSRRKESCSICSKHCIPSLSVHFVLQGKVGNKYSLETCAESHSFHLAMWIWTHAIRDVTTTRNFTSKQWGGHTQSNFPIIQPGMLARHGLNDFMYLNLFLNPHALQWPGAPGLFFASSVNPEASERPQTERVLVSLLKANRWLYVVQYQCTPAPSLTPEGWKSQAPKVNT